MNRLRAWLEVCRVSNLPTVWTNIAAAWWLSGARDGIALGNLLTGASLVYLAGMALNDAFDADIDREERPGRPIPSGRLSDQEVGLFGLVGLFLGALLMCLAGAGFWLAAALVLAVFSYNWLHAQSPLTVLLLGLCRALLWWIPATLPGHVFSPVIAIWSGVLFVYVIGLSLLARNEMTVRRFGGPRIIGGLLAAIPLIDAAAVAPAPLAILLAAAFPLCLLLQRAISAS